MRILLRNRSAKAGRQVPSRLIKNKRGYLTPSKEPFPLWEGFLVVCIRQSWYVVSVAGPLPPAVYVTGAAGMQAADAATKCSNRYSENKLCIACIKDTIFGRGGQVFL